MEACSEVGTGGAGEEEVRCRASKRAADRRRGSRIPVVPELEGLAGAWHLHGSFRARSCTAEEETGGGGALHHDAALLVLPMLLCRTEQHQGKSRRAGLSCSAPERASDEHLPSPLQSQESAPRLPPCVVQSYLLRAASSRRSIPSPRKKYRA